MAEGLLPHKNVGDPVNDCKGVVTLYRLRDADGTLIYIGITEDADRRMREHRDAGKVWALCSLERFLTRQEAEDAERRAIFTERPRFNKRWACAENHTPADLRADGYITEVRALMEQHAATFGLKLSSIGQMAVRNRRVYDNIVRKTIQMNTAQALADWIAADRTKRVTA